MNLYISDLHFGHKHLILGNHNIKIQSNKEAMSYFESVDRIKIINILMYDTEVGRFYQMSEAGKYEIEPYEEAAMNSTY